MVAHIQKTEYGTYRVQYRDLDGASQSLTFKKKADAKGFLHEMESSKNKGSYVSPRLGGTLFGDWAKEVQAALALPLRNSTRASDESVLRSLVLPHFEKRRLASVTTIEVQGWVSKLSETHSPSTVRKAHQLLAGVFSAAVNADMLSRTPCRAIRLPKIERTEMRFLSPVEIDRLANLIDPRYRALVLTAGYTGARFGELAALRIGHEGLDLLRKRMTIRATLTEVRGHLEVGPPKTKAANRSVSLPRFIVDELAHHLENHGGDHVFTSPDGKVLRRNNFRRRVWLPAVKAAGLEGVRFHDLRHSHAAMLIAAGEHPRLISGRLGHATIRTTLDTYGHLFPGLDEAAADRLDQLFAEGVGADRGQITRIAAPVSPP